MRETESIVQPAENEVSAVKDESDDEPSLEGTVGQKIFFTEKVLTNVSRRVKGERKLKSRRDNKRVYKAKLQSAEEIQKKSFWSKEDRELFLVGLRKFGKNYSQIHEMLPHLRMSQISRRANYVYYQLNTKGKTEPADDELIELLRPRTNQLGSKSQKCTKKCTKITNAK